jgi:hypothetical protein
MPDDTPSKGKEEKTVQNIPQPEAFNTPPPPNDPPAPAAKNVPDEHMAAEVKDLEDRIRGAEKWMIYLTGAIAFFGLCTVAVGILQWCVMSGQLSEMKASLEVTDRAWVEIGDVTTPPLNGMLGLAFWPNRSNPNEKPQVRFGFNVEYKNVGHSTALSIKLAQEIYLMDVRHYSDNTAVEAEQKRFCNSPIEDYHIETSGKSILSPGQSSMSYRIAMSDITEATSYIDKERGRVVMPVVIICVDYRSSKTGHTTSAIYDLWPGDMMPSLPRLHLFGVWVIDPSGLKTPRVIPQRIDADDYAN